MRRTVALALLAIGAAASVASAASRYDPALRFRVVSTPHFWIYFHQHAEEIARRFAPVAEQVHERLVSRLKTTTGGRTHVILVDQNDLANGWANPLPYDVIELNVTPPLTRNTIANTDDWLRLVFTHEYTHILQLDRSRGFASAVRSVLGRSPLAFPNLFLPLWQVEGLAVYEESATGRGRLNAGDFALFVTQPARSGHPLPLDRATGDFDDWPGGTTPYAYGGFFTDYLARRFGEEKLADLSSRTAGRFYFLSSPAFKQTFGKSLGDLWKDFQADAARPAPGGSNAGRRLTSEGFYVSGPRFVGGSRDGAPSSQILFTFRTADDFPALMTVDVDGHLRRVASRYLGDVTDVAGDAAVFDQIDLARSVALRSDLYLLHLHSARVDRLTADGRHIDPAVAPGGTALACVTANAGRMDLAVFDLPSGAWPADLGRLRTALAARPRVELAEPGVEYFSPRWSPDGRRIAVSRRVRGRGTDLAVVDAASGHVRIAVTSERDRIVTPVWTPDGRTIVFAWDRGGGPFNVYAVDIDGADARTSAVYQITDRPSGASYPDVSPDGTSLVYVGYTPAGYDLFLLPFDRSTWRELRPGLDSFSATAGDQKMAANETRPGLDSQDYRPWRTLPPRYWMPAFDWSDEQLKIGAQTSGNDVLGRHSFAATFLARVAGEPGAPASRRYDWAASYAYDRWVPTFFADASDRTQFLRDVQTRGGVLPADLREQNAEAGVLVPDFHVRYQQAFTASVNLQRQTVNLGGTNLAPSSRNAMRFAWSLSSAKVYPYSISPEQGVTLGLTSEWVAEALGADANARSATADARSYLRLGGRHAILAVRGALGASAGDARTSRLFFLGGTGPNASPTDFGSDALNLLRGFDQNEFAGTRLAVINAEYRVPLVRVERGAGTWPVFLRTLHATVFVDAGKAWTERFSRVPFQRSAGLEVAANVRLAYTFPLTAALGVAWPHTVGVDSRPAAVYVRVGRAF